jgi:hypothetical protein
MADDDLPPDELAAVLRLLRNIWPSVPPRWSSGDGTC